MQRYDFFNWEITALDKIRELTAKKRQKTAKKMARLLYLQS